MRAVNLIPADERRSGAAGSGRSGGMVYALLGALFAGLVMVMALTLVNRSLSDRRVELADVKAQADAAQAKAASLAPYTQFAALRAKRVETVKSLAASRFDWSHAMHEVARVIPENVWLQSLKGSVSPETGGGSGLRGAVSAPAIEISGCTTSHKSVSRMMSRMRLVDGVQRVSLDSSAKAGGATGGGGCGTSDQHPSFQMLVFFKAPAVPAAAAATPATPGSTP